MPATIMVSIVPNRQISQQYDGSSTANGHCIVSAGSATILQPNVFNLYPFSFVLALNWPPPPIPISSYRKDAVKISMDTFIKRFQPENYNKWRSGNDNGLHPEDIHRSRYVQRLNEFFLMYLQWNLTPSTSTFSDSMISKTKSKQNKNQERTSASKRYCRIKFSVVLICRWCLNKLYE